MKNMLSKEEFVDAVNRLKDANDLVCKVNDLFTNSRENVECDFCNGAALQIAHESLVIKLLEKIMDDPANNITYFIYELDYGREYKPGYVKDEAGNSVDFSTAEALYDYLTKQ